MVVVVVMVVAVNQRAIKTRKTSLASRQIEACLKLTPGGPAPSRAAARVPWPCDLFYIFIILSISPIGLSVNLSANSGTGGALIDIVSSNSC